MAEGVSQLLLATESDRSGMGGVVDRFMLSGEQTGGRLALVQHIFEPRALAAPMHRHRNEDEYTYVLEGRIGAILDGQEFEAGPGDLILKPRDQWHTFWNAGDEPASCLEIIAAAGIEKLFRELGALKEEPTPELLAEAAARFGCDLDFDATFPLIERHRLQF